MDQHFRELKKVLTEELEIHANCVTTATAMNTAIKEKDVEKVQWLTDQFDNFMARIEILEMRRLELCDSITKAGKTENRHLNLQNIIALVPGEERKSFEDIRASLKKNIANLAKINTANQLLLNESLKAIEKNFELFAQSQTIPSGYKQSGVMERKSIRKNIVNQVA